MFLQNTRTVSSSDAPFSVNAVNAPRVQLVGHGPMGWFLQESQKPSLGVPPQSRLGVVSAAVSKLPAALPPRLTVHVQFLHRHEPPPADPHAALVRLRRASGRRDGRTCRSPATAYVTGKTQLPKHTNTLFFGTLSRTHFWETCRKKVVHILVYQMVLQV